MGRYPCIRRLAYIFLTTGTRTHSSCNHLLSSDSSPPLTPSLSSPRLPASSSLCLEVVVLLASGLQPLLMESAAIRGSLWVLGKALSPLSGGLVEAWAATSGLGPNIEALKTELLYAQAMLDNARGREIRSHALAELLQRLRALAYGADDVLDELDYFRIQDELDGTFETIDDNDRGCVHNLVRDTRHTAKAATKLLGCGSCSSAAGDTYRPDESCMCVRRLASRTRTTVHGFGKRLLCSSPLPVRDDSKHAPGVSKFKFDRVDVSTRMKCITDELKPLSAKVSTILGLELSGSVITELRLLGSSGIVGSSNMLQLPGRDAIWQLPVTSLKLWRSNFSGKEVTRLLTHLPELSGLNIWRNEKITRLGVEAQQQQMAASLSLPASPAFIELQDTHGTDEHQERVREVEEEDDGLLLLPASLQELFFDNCPELILAAKNDETGGGGGLQAMRSLKIIGIEGCPKFLSAYMASDLSSCCPFPSSLQHLSLDGRMEGMDTLVLLSNLTSLENLRINYLGEDFRCEGLLRLLTQGQLTALEVLMTPKLFADWDPARELQGEQLLPFPKLQQLETDDVAGVLTAPICRLLSSSLTELSFKFNKAVECFTKEQEEALSLFTSLQDLQFKCCDTVNGNHLSNQTIDYSKDCLGVVHSSSLVGLSPSVHRLHTTGFTVWCLFHLHKSGSYACSCSLLHTLYLHFRHVIATFVTDLPLSDGRNTDATLLLEIYLRQ
ncbi:hypothetical protein ZWY2020_058842 [Hordeum vulgare]|nr:hypothetical protein ZWY2020_058842 [Hordeum vulgare]